MAKKGIQMYFDVREQDGTYVGRERCDLCRQKFDSHGYHVVVDPGGGPGLDWHSVICGGCFNTDPKVMAEAFRQRAPILRKARLRGYDPGANIEWANSMLSIAEDLEKVKSLKELDGGIMAVKVMEAYRELDALKRGRKVA